MKRSLVIVALLRIGLSNVRLSQASLAFHQRHSLETKKTILRQENGFRFKLENGKSLLIEKDGTKAFNVKPSVVNPADITLENNKNILLESGSIIKQE